MVPGRTGRSYSRSYIMCVCFKAPRTYTPVLGALVSPLGTHTYSVMSWE